MDALTVVPVAIVFLGLVTIAVSLTRVARGERQAVFSGLGFVTIGSSALLTRVPDDAGGNGPIILLWLGLLFVASDLVLVFLERFQGEPSSQLSTTSGLVKSNQYRRATPIVMMGVVFTGIAGLLLLAGVVHPVAGWTLVAISSTQAVVGGFVRARMHRLPGLLFAIAIGAPASAQVAGRDPVEGAIGAMMRASQLTDKAQVPLEECSFRALLGEAIDSLRCAGGDVACRSTGRGSMYSSGRPATPGAFGLGRHRLECRGEDDAACPGWSCPRRVLCDAGSHALRTGIQAAVGVHIHSLTARRMC